MGRRPSHHQHGLPEGAKPNLVAVDRKTGWGTRRWSEVVLKSDGERALVKMKMGASEASQEIEESSCGPAGDSRANGLAEAAVREPGQ